jgi:hypothetical protein
MNRDITQRLRAAAVGEELPCMAAFELVETEGLPAIELGRAATDAGIRIIHCQLNLFGYRAFGEKRLPITVQMVPESVAEAVREAADGDRLTCAAAWSLAGTLGLPRPMIGQVAENLGVRIVHCQLGCF